MLAPESDLNNNTGAVFNPIAKRKGSTSRALSYHPSISGTEEKNKNDGTDPCMPLRSSSRRAAPSRRRPSRARATRSGRATERYMAAQAAGKPATLLELAGSPPGPVDYTEDGLVRDLQKGILSTPLRIDHNRSDSGHDAVRHVHGADLDRRGPAARHRHADALQRDHGPAGARRVPGVSKTGARWRRERRRNKTANWLPPPTGHRRETGPSTRRVRWPMPSARTAIGAPQGGNETADARLARRDVIQGSRRCLPRPLQQQIRRRSLGLALQQAGGQHVHGQRLRHGQLQRRRALGHCHQGPPLRHRRDRRRRGLPREVLHPAGQPRIPSREGRIRFVHTLTIMRNLTG